MPDREPTLGEIARGLRELKASTDRLIETIERTYVRRDVHGAEQAAMEQRVGRVEERLNWTFRVAVSGLLLPVLVVLILAIIVAIGE